MERRQLVSIPPFEKRIPEDVYNNLENIVWDALLSQNNPEEFFAPFEFPFENLQKIAESDNEEYKENIRAMADDVWSQNLWLSALLIYYILLHITTFLPTDFYKFAYVLAKFGKENEAIALVDVYQNLSTNKKTTYHALANFYYCALDIPEKAIEYFEKFIELDNTNALAYNSIGHLYADINEPDSLEKQLYYFKKAYELAPNDPNFVKSLLTVYEKLHDTEKVKEFYPKLMELAHTPRHALNYGLYEFSWGNIQKGCKFFQERFELENYPVGYPKDILTISNKWNYIDDISDKILLIHYEEGFGDSIMYGRFLPLIKQYAKEVVLVLQDKLINLFKNSSITSDGIKIFDNIQEALQYVGNKPYLHMPLMDLPYPLGVDSCFIPYDKKYLNNSKIVELGTKSYKIGIAYSGDISANYGGRDIELKEFYSLAKITGVQLYSFQVGEAAKALNDVPSDINIIDLGKSFDDFLDTANALASMDLFVTTDNVLLNLAGALGVKTFGIFNKYPNYRWFDLSGNDVVWYKSVKPFQCVTENDWSEVMKRVITDVEVEVSH
ncbi:TPA: hypothetical protein CPT80_02305 [Candidatus Gastranaerophilales bacterium HUM_9]|nr:MAG TPA: hypothetical protein CPT80_02305 [Candidatus Gastranaerophilales bacterium HUM_9]HBX34693.1 hypothetical protein [Cyanobacteria bacterium UBA11440]